MSATPRCVLRTVVFCEHAFRRLARLLSVAFACTRLALEVSDTFCPVSVLVLQHEWTRARLVLADCCGLCSVCLRFRRRSWARRRHCLVLRQHSGQWTLKLPLIASYTTAGKMRRKRRSKRGKTTKKRRGLASLGASLLSPVGSARCASVRLSAAGLLPRPRKLKMRRTQAAATPKGALV